MNPVEESEKLVARIIARLKQNGVFYEEIYASKFFPAMELHERVLFQEAVEWVGAEGLVRIRKSYTGGSLSELVVEAVLTSKGYAVLNNLFPTGETVNQVIENIDKNSAGYAGIGDFIGGILGGFTKSMAS